MIKNGLLSETGKQNKRVLFSTFSGFEVLVSTTLPKRPLNAPPPPPPPPGLLNNDYLMHTFLNACITA